MRSIRRSGNLMAIAFLALSFASVSMAMNASGFDFKSRGEALISVWDEVAGLFAFGSRSVSANELAMFSAPTDPLCPEFDLPGHESFALVRYAEKGEASPASMRCRQKAPPVAAGKGRAIRVARRAELPRQRIDIAKMIMAEYSSGIEELSSQARELARYRIFLKRAMRVRAAVETQRDVAQTFPVLVIDRAPGDERRIEVRGFRPLKQSVTMAPAIRKCES